MERSIYKARKRAKKYKNWFETISLNPFPWLINDRLYFMITYMKRNTIQGVAIVSDKKQESVNDAREAHHPLFLFYRLMNHIHATGQLRSNIDPSYFEDALQLSQNHGLDDLKDGQALIQSLYEKQTHFKEIFENFFAHLALVQRKKQPLSKEEIQLAIHTSASLEMLHYEIILETAENFQVLNNWVETMQKEKLWDDIKQPQRVFYLQMIRNKNAMEEELKNLPVVKHKNRDEMLKLTKEKYASFKDDARKKELNELRYP
ncbi:hypothetical protein ACM26V_22545 [Salipaludibacillus sp. HK11]|uniref:hypothetical protein n=1 Tax=Salipaludibacillus sp. HK11 TaxID=3394320 RepID=UPI0039FBDE0E